MADARSANIKASSGRSSASDVRMVGDENRVERIERLAFFVGRQGFVPASERSKRRGPVKPRDRIIDIDRHRTGG